MDSLGFLIVSILILILASNYFSRMETALNEAHRGRLEKLADDGDSNAKRSLELLEAPDDFIATTQIGKIFVGIFAGFIVVIMHSRLEFFFGSFARAELISIVISIIIIAAILILFGEFLPKQVARQHPEQELLAHHGSLDFMRTIFSPILFAMKKFSSLAFLMFGMSENKIDAVIEDEVKDLIDQGTEDGTFEQVEHDMVDRIFHLSDQTVSALMIPRTQMVWLDLEDSLEKNLEKIKTNMHTFFPVGRGSLDSFAGILSTKTLLDFILENGDKNIDLEQLLNKPIFAPRAMETFRLLEKFRESGLKVAVVIDEYGGVVGEITLGHILEVIIDTPIIEKKKDPSSFKQKDSNSWYVEGLCPITEFKERFDLDELPDEEHDHFQTMGGFLTSYFGYIPKVGELCAWNGFRFEIVRMDRARIDKILVTQLHDDNQ